jgi:hypothetical protein
MESQDMEMGQVQNSDGTVGEDVDVEEKEEDKEGEEEEGVSQVLWGRGVCKVRMRKVRKARKVWMVRRGRKVRSRRGRRCQVMRTCQIQMIWFWQVWKVRRGTRLGQVMILMPRRVMMMIRMMTIT